MAFQALEICSASLRSVQAAVAAGAQRVELCKALELGGVTPSYGMAGMACTIGIRVNILIRPRGGDFLYSSEEAEEILRDISQFGKLGIHGVVVGALTPEAKVDRDMCTAFLREARKIGATSTFHRAIDRTDDLLEALDTVMSIGYDRVLTSGGHPTAYEGMDVIRKMQEMSVRKNGSGGSHTIIMPGSGVNPGNIREIVGYTGVTEAHFSASKSVPSGMKVKGGIAVADPATVTHSDAALIRAALEQLGLH